jgi:hypothetical protein
LRCELVFGLDIAGGGAHLADARQCKARFVGFRPDLDMVPGVTEVLPEYGLAIIVEALARRERGTG